MPRRMRGRVRSCENSMWKDPIIEEVRTAREAIAKQFGYDLKRIFADARKAEKKRAATKSKRATAKRDSTAKQSGKRNRKAA